MIARFASAGVPKEEVSFVAHTCKFNSPAAASELVDLFRRCYGPTIRCWNFERVHRNPIRTRRSVHPSTQLSTEIVDNSAGGSRGSVDMGFHSLLRSLGTRVTSGVGGELSTMLAEDGCSPFGARAAANANSFSLWTK